MAEVRASLAVCIPTYRRPLLLHRLLDDLSRQTVLPGQLIVVDGDPSAPDVRAVLESGAWPFPSLCYVPSNHANLPFQRYVGRLAARGFERLVYLDDDVRIHRRALLEKLVWPLDADACGVVAATGEVDHAVQPAKAGLMARLLGASRHLAAGHLSPTGCRKQTAPNGDAYSFVQWLRGGVMAFSIAALTESCFSEDVFALYERRLGRGEDTVLALRVARYGRLVAAHDARVEHPSDDPPRAYPSRGFQSGCALAYSRRLINDNYRGFDRPTWSDRAALAKHYVGMNLSNLVRVCRHPSRSTMTFGSGYAWGTVQGVFRKPSSKSLAPGTDWRGDALSCVRRAVLHSNLTVCR